MIPPTAVYRLYPTETLERWEEACLRANQYAEAAVIRREISTRSAREEAA